MPPNVHPHDFDREAIEAARSTPASDKLRDGLRLFDRACRVMADGIRHQRPGITNQGVLQTLRERVRLARRLEWR